MTVFAHERRLRVACARGVTTLLAREVRELGLPVLHEDASGVESTGSVTDAMRLNLWVRTGQRVLYELDAFQATTADQVYQRTARVAWEDIIPPDGYLSVTSFAQTPAIRDARFLNLKVKDAIVDRLRRVCGRRPDSGAARTGVVVYVHWVERDCRLCLDTSGESLSRRGYRLNPLDAPLQESLGAALVLATGWTGQEPFVNPMCGSGTLAIEAALLAAGVPPGSLRPSFAFMALHGYATGAWEAARKAAGPRPPLAAPGRIVATDLRPAAIEAARDNARRAGVLDRIEFAVCDFRETTLPPGNGVVIFNPEYGARMGTADALPETYRAIGDFLKQRAQGYTGHVFTGNLELGKQIGLRSSRRLPFFNGPIECRLLKFDLYAGTHRRFGGDGAGAAASPAGGAG